MYRPIVPIYCYYILDHGQGNSPFSFCFGQWQLSLFRERKPAQNLSVSVLLDQLNRKPAFWRGGAGQCSCHGICSIVAFDQCSWFRYTYITNILWCNSTTKIIIISWGILVQMSHRMNYALCSRNEIQTYLLFMNITFLSSGTR